MRNSAERVLLSLAVLLGASCATRLVDEFAVSDMADAPPGDTIAFFTGAFTWDSSVSSGQTACDNGGRAVDRVAGDFLLARGPAAHQVNIGVGTGGCPIFIFNVDGDTATLANSGVTCRSGPGTMTTRTGTLTTADGGQSIAFAAVLDLEVPSGNGFVHCVLTIGGVARRKQ